MCICCASSNLTSIANLITLISSSSYYDVLISKEVAGLFDLSFSGDLAKLKRDLKDRMLEYLSEDGGDLSPRDRQLIVATAGIASLAIFAQANWTGPPLAIPFAPIPALASVSADSALVLDWVRAELAREGEDAWSKLQYPVYLIVANVLLVDCSYALRLLDVCRYLSRVCLNSFACLRCGRVRIGGGCERSSVTSSYYRARRRRCMMR